MLYSIITEYHMIVINQKLPNILPLLRSFCLRSQLKLFSSIFSFSRFATMVGVKTIRSVLFSLQMIHKLEVLNIKCRDSIPFQKQSILYKPFHKLFILINGKNSLNFVLNSFSCSVHSKKRFHISVYPIVVSFWSFIFDSMSPERMISKVYSYFKLTHYASQMLFSNVINVKTVQLS